MLLLHILTAITCAGFSAYLYFSPSRSKLRMSYGLLAGTVGTGTYLVVSSHAPIVQSCVTGLTFVGASLIGVVLAKRKLAKAEIKND
ncbi:MAG TPA: hypothetical protein VLH38_04645 [Patescibacteria group bacterium]|nr:hypothetical protein [Patescibacteria group bacterium]